MEQDVWKMSEGSRAKTKKLKSWNSLTFYVYACTHVTITRRSKSTLRLFALLACKYEVKFIYFCKFTTILKWIEIICISKIKNQRKRFLSFSQNCSNIYLLISQSDCAIWNSFLYEMNTRIMYNKGWSLFFVDRLLSYVTCLLLNLGLRVSCQCGNLIFFLFWDKGYYAC